MERMHWNYDDLVSLPQEYFERLIEKLTNESEGREE
jgi:hypothetical protein